MEPGERAEVLAEVRALLARDPATAGRAEIELAYRTDVFVWTRRRRVRGMTMDDLPSTPLSPEISTSPGPTRAGPRAL